LGIPKADPVLAAFVAVMIAKVGVDILRETLPVLVDQAALDPGQIAGIVEDVGGIESFHKVRSRGAAGSAAIDLHIRVSPDKTIQEANAIADEVRRRLLSLRGVSDVTVHVEAQRQPAHEAADLFAGVKLAASELGLTVHEIWAHRQGSGVFLEMDVGVDPDLTLGVAHDLVDRLEREIKNRLPEVREVHTHIELATSQVLKGGEAELDLEVEARREIERVVAGMPSLSRPHNIHMRRNPADAGQIYLSLECTISPEVPVTQAHQLATQLEQELSRRLPEVADVSVHLEPPDQD
jgi:divalent metal cation (Fe/Co/Zn/Cd) transporter